MFCWQCGKELYPGAFFCTNCGMRIRQQETSVQVPSTKVPNVPVAADQEQAVQRMQPMAAVREQEMTAPAKEPEAAMQEPEKKEQEAEVPPPEVRVPEMRAQMQSPEVSEPETQEQTLQSEVPVPVPGMGIPELEIPVREPDREKPKKGVLAAVTVMAVLLFLVGVIGAFYFSDAGYGTDDSRTIGQREDDREDNGDFGEDLDDSEGSEESESRREEDPGDRADTPEAPDESESYAGESDEESMAELPDGNDGEGMQEAPREDGPEIEAFSGRDIYPDLDGYAEGRAGDTMHTYWFNYTVTRAYVCAGYGGYTPPAGTELLVVKVVLKSTFDTSIPMYDTDFQAQWSDPSDNAYAYPMIDAERLGEGILPEEYILESGQTVTGLLLYEVPEGYTEFSLSFLEHYDNNSYGDLFFLYFTVDRRQNNSSL